MVRTWMLVVLGACGSVSEKPDAAMGSDTPPPIDGPTDSPTVDAMLGAFGPPTKIAELSSTKEDWGVTLRADQLEVFFASNRTSSADDIFSATRATTSAPWGAPTLVAALSSTAFDLQPSLSPDGLTIWFTSNRGGAGFEIMTSVRASLAGGWSVPVAVPELNSTADEAPMNVLANGMTMAFTSNRGGNYDIYLATRAGASGAWTSTALAMGVNTTGDEFDAQLTQDGLGIYFTTPGSALDLVYAHRASTSAAFATPVPLTEVLAVGKNEEDLWVSADERTIVFASDRDGTRDLWQATR